MTPATATKAPPRRPPPRNGGNGGTSHAPTGPVLFAEIKQQQSHRIVLYGPGGIGKTTLAATAPGPVAFFDLDDSLAILKPSLGELDIRRVNCSPTFDGIRGALAGDGWDDINTIVIDSATRAEEIVAEWMMANIKTDKGLYAQRMEDYSYGRGYRHLYDTFLLLVTALDTHVRAGRNVILIAHEAVEKHPNPQGEDWLRSEPRLQNTPKSSVRARMRDWTDHLLFLGYDVAVAKGKGQGSGTRTIYPTELPHCMAKSRKLADPLELVLYDTTLWTQLFGKEDN